jgi:heat-inducible transcriptional repressor
MELTDRKRQILKVVVESYIDSAEPIGSKAIAEKLPVHVSSATIRNELADLETMGYLDQPHTSAGRVPSPKGYRIYVNELMEQHPLSETERSKINEALQGKMAQMDEVVAKAGQLASSFVNYPTFAVADPKTQVMAARYELIAVDEDSFVAVVMLTDSRVKSQLMRLELSIEKEKLPEMAVLLNEHFTRVAPKEMNRRLMSLSEQISAQWFLLVSQVIEYAQSLLEQAEEKQVFTTGASQLLNFPEYRDVDKAQDLMRFMADNKNDLPLPTTDGAMQILIGPENVSDALKDSSVVVASYDIGENMRGLIGVVGPTRMDYATVAARLSYFAENLGRMFGKKQLPTKEEKKE